MTTVELETEWVIFGGPLIGMAYDRIAKGWVFIVGDPCRPKYYGVQTLSVRLGETRLVVFYWQTSFAEYFSVCLTKGFFYLKDPEALAWLDIGVNKATAAFYLSPRYLYSSDSYLEIDYKHIATILKFQIFYLYN